MPIDRLGPTSQLLAALRAEISRVAPARSASTASKTSVTARDPAVLRKEVKDILRGVAIDDEPAVSDARRRFVRAVLLWEFGPQLREYSEWQPMLDTLVATLERSEVQRNAFATLVRESNG